MAVQQAASDGFRHNRYLQRDDTNQRDELTVRGKLALALVAGWDATTGVPAPARAAEGAPSSGRLPGLDGLRALAIVAVLTFHLDPSWLPGGHLQGTHHIPHRRRMHRLHTLRPSVPCRCHLC